MIFDHAHVVRIETIDPKKPRFAIKLTNGQFWGEYWKGVYPVKTIRSWSDSKRALEKLKYLKEHGAV